MVKILRLATGEDIVGMVSETKTSYKIMTPFKVIFRRLHKRTVGLTITPWLPDELLEEHTMTLAKMQVVCELIPKKEFIEYYHRISDEFYMTLVDLDSVYRSQLEQLDKPLSGASGWSHADELMARAYAQSEGSDMFDEMDESLREDDDEPPMFH